MCVCVQIQVSVFVPRWYIYIYICSDVLELLVWSVIDVCLFVCRYKSVCSFHAASERYGLLDVKEDCMTWLLQYLMSPANSPLLTDITWVLLRLVFTFVFPGVVVCPWLWDLMRVTVCVWEGGEGGRWWGEYFCVFCGCFGPCFQMSQDWFVKWM